MEFWAHPYLFYYLAMFFFWMLGIHRQILFWLYLWQLKEYHLGRFWAHFETQKGKNIFINPRFLAKIALLAFGLAYYFATEKILLPLAVAFLFFSLQAVWAIWGIAKRNLLHPQITKKSLMLLAATHLSFFALMFFIFSLFLGEMDLFDFGLAAGLLLVIDILLPLIVGLTVLVLQPFTNWQKNKIIARAQKIIAKRTDLLVIAITGSYGKSATKELLAHILSKKFKVLKTAANQNTEMGVAQTVIKNLLPKHQIFVCEIGAVHKGKICQTAKIVNPKIGIITGINQQHLGVFGNQQKIIDAKFELLETLPQTGTAIVNWKSKIISENFEAQKEKIKTKNIIFVGKDIQASDINANIAAHGGEPRFWREHLTLNIDYKNQKIQLNTNARGAFMVEPILLAVSGALAAGLQFAEIIEILNKTDFTPFNLKVSQSAGIQPPQIAKGVFGDPTPAKSPTIVDSTYSANPSGVMAHLDYLKLWPSGAASNIPSGARGRKAIVMPCLIELGSVSKEIHYQIGQKIAQVCDLAIITTKDRFKEIKAGALLAGMKPQNIVFCDNPKKISELLQTRLATNDIILLEGRLAQNLLDIFSALK